MVRMRPTTTSRFLAATATTGLALALALTTAAPATADKPSDSTTGTTGKPGVGHCLRIDTVKVKGRRPSRPPA